MTSLAMPPGDAPGDGGWELMERDGGWELMERDGGWELRERDGAGSGEDSVGGKTRVSPETRVSWS